MDDWERKDFWHLVSIGMVLLLAPVAIFGGVALAVWVDGLH